MAELTLIAPKYNTVPGYEVVRAGVATEDIPAGSAVVQTATGWSIAPAGTVDFHGIALQSYYAGQGGCSFLIQGEFDGFAGLTPGANVFVSTTVAGGWADAGASGALVRARAVTPTRISVSCV